MAKTKPKQLLHEYKDKVLLDRGCGTVCRAMSLSVRLSLLFVENSDISFLVCLSLDIDCFLFLSRGPWGFYLGHVTKFIYNTIQYKDTRLMASFQDNLGRPAPERLNRSGF